MQLLCAAHRHAEETGDLQLAAETLKLADQLEARRTRAGAGVTPAPSAQSDGSGEAQAYAPAYAAAGPARLAEDKPGADTGKGRRRGGSDAFRFIEAPALHTRLLREVFDSMQQMVQATRTLTARLEQLRRAAACVESHRGYLLEQLGLYRTVRAAFAAYVACAACAACAA